MSNPNERVQQWVQEISSYSHVDWSRMPEIDLYMDQVITYMDKQLSVFRRNDDAKALTSSMINNYVKDELLKSPERKKYSRDHLAALHIICMLKQVLSIPDVSDLLKLLGENQSMEDMYASFRDIQKKAFTEVSDRVSEMDDNRGSLIQLALELSIEANARRTAVEKIISEMSRGDVVK